MRAPHYLEELQYESILSLFSVLHKLAAIDFTYMGFTVGYIEDYVERIAV